MARAGNGDQESLLTLLSDKEFWEPNGRVGVITQGEYTNRMILFYPEPTPGHWTEVVSSSLEEGPLDSYILADEYAANVPQRLRRGVASQKQRRIGLGAKSIRLAAGL
jgi:hypothetical protein